MRVPYNWLKDYVDLEEPAAEVARRLQGVGIPVEGVEREGPEVTGVVTGLVLTVDPHPDADRLRVAQVDVGGGQRVQIVTAATNVRVGQVVAVALHGALLAGGQRIKRGKLRGVASEGMFCSAVELGLEGLDLPPEQREGILDLPEGLAPGQDVNQAMALAEEILVLETFANRPDQLSLLGVAREVAAVFGRSLRVPPTGSPAFGEPLPEGLVEIQDLEGCPRYVGRVVEDIRVGPSPDWMVRRLQAAGVRSINNVVDITNYVMIETGQPLHAFDMDLLEGGRVVVRRSRAGEAITTLDGDRHPLPEGTLVIADAEKPVAVAGVMGGLHSEVGEGTTRVLLESASFAPADVRRASLRLGLRTESSKRFEKGADQGRVALGSERAARLLADLAGRLRPGAVDRGVPAPAAVTLRLRPARIRQVLGVEIPADRARVLLEGLGFACREAGSGLEVRVPSHRQDVASEIDLVEEVARHHGYDNIPSTVPRGEPRGASLPEDEGEEWTRQALARLGWSELITPSLHGPDLPGRYLLEADPPTIVNPLSEDQGVLRPSLFPPLLEAVRRNLRMRNRELRLFEVGRVFSTAGDEVREPLRVGLALCVPGGGFFELKGALERLAGLARLDFTFAAEPRPWLHPGRAAVVAAGDRTLGWAGELHPALAEELDVDSPVAVAELDLDALLELRGRPGYRGISRFPSVERDLALVVPEEVPAGRLAARLLQVGGDLAETVAPFDVYRGGQVPAGHKSVALRAVLQAPDRTLTEDEIERALRKMIKVAEREFGAQLRS